MTQRPSQQPPSSDATNDGDDAGQQGHGVVTITRFSHRVLAILWPAFMMAGVLEMLVFALADPDELHWMGGAPIDLSRSAVYTLAFLVFWGVISTAGALTQLLLADPGDLNTVRHRRSAPHWPR
ncbi:MAG: hypothetical protein RIQ60_3301 [Pseudomonadota bacterium]|jgi:hypothetical protein